MHWTGRQLKKGFLALAFTFGAEASFVQGLPLSPVADQEGAGPFVTAVPGGYLYTKTTGENILLGFSASLHTLGSARMQSIYEAGSLLENLWAPEIWRLDGCWYVYSAAAVPGEGIQRMYVLSLPEENPLEGERTLSKVEGMDGRWAIDGTVLDLGEERYFLWSGWEGEENVRQDLYISRMESPTKVLPEKVCLSIPTYPWGRIPWRRKTGSRSRSPSWRPRGMSLAPATTALSRRRRERRCYSAMRPGGRGPAGAGMSVSAFFPLTAGEGS